MSGGTCMPGTNIDSVEQRQAFDKLMKDKTINDWMHNEFAVEMGWTDKTTFEWLWKKYTGNQYFDPATIKINPKAIIPTEIFSLVMSGPNKKSSANSGLHKIIFLIKRIPAITINKIPIAENQFLPLREYSLLMIKHCS